MRREVEDAMTALIRAILVILSNRLTGWAGAGIALALLYIGESSLPVVTTSWV